MYFKLRNSANPSNFEKRKGILIKLCKSTPQRLRTLGNTEKLYLLLNSALFTLYFFTLLFIYLFYFLFILIVKFIYL